MSEQVGKCLCGGVRFRLNETPKEVTVCHCGICRRLSGGTPPASASISAPAFDADDSLKWRQSSPWGQRGFCAECGTQLFWRAVDKSGWVVFAGALENPPPLKIERHIFIDEKPDFYDFTDNAPRLTGEEWFKVVVEILRAEKGDAVADQAIEMAKAAKLAK